MVWHLVSCFVRISIQFNAFLIAVCFFFAFICFVAGNGQIDIHDLSEALKDIHLSQVYAETFLRQTDTTNRGHVNLAEFIHYVREHEKNLLLHFTHLDKDGDGKVNLDDLISGFKELGIDIDSDEATQLLKRVDQDDTLIITYDEWRGTISCDDTHYFD